MGENKNIEKYYKHAGIYLLGIIVNTTVHLKQCHFKMAEIIKKFIQIIKSFIATLDPDLITGIKGSLIASLIFILIAFFFKELKRFFISLFALIFNLLRTRKSKIKAIQI